MDIKLNLGNYQSATIGIDEADSFDACKAELQENIKQLVRDGFDPMAINMNVLAFLGMKKSDLID